MVLDMIVCIVGVYRVGERATAKVWAQMPLSWNLGHSEQASLLNLISTVCDTGLLSDMTIRFSLHFGKGTIPSRRKI